MPTLLIQGGRVLSPEDALDSPLDLFIENGAIKQMARHIEARADEVLDAAGEVVAPGFIDLHAHLRESPGGAPPSGEISETLESGLAAAVAGGFTAVCPMPNTQPVNDRPESTRALVETAARLGLARVFPIAAVTVGSEGARLTDFGILAAAGAVAFSDDGRPVKTAELMRQAMERAGELGVPIVDHCEDPALSRGGAIHEGEISQRLGVKGIPGVSEERCLERDLQIAEATGAHFHAAHLSTAGSIQLVREAKRRGVRVTCEVTPHHFSLTDEAVVRFGANAKMNPPLGSAKDLEGIRAGIANGTVDAIATDHAPHAPSLKAKPLAEAPFGVIGFETALALALAELVHPGQISLSHLIVLMSSNPARLIRQPLGRIRVGGAADLTVFNPALEWTYRVSESRSKSRNSPFDGQSFKGGVTATVVTGRVVYRAPSR